MAGKNGKDGRELETAWIRELAGILEETGLTEIEIEKDAVRLRVSRQGGATQYVAGPAPAAAAPATGAAPAAPAAAEHAGAVKSPMVGTAYLSPSPDAAAFISEGAQVAEGQTIMIIEAMKTMNPMAAPRAGWTTKILVTDAQPVEFDDTLCIIE
ncbi:Biotin carboxyl carrier protein of acetyl-CoA carboxylase [hydrothermal vent metagenome]|uniref:Biotin carboxyl carrier protein of acetyl-CoA carboxylase n=1 Tax=hydrothermal vent metagenome TaxID=652676 RepID=A0A3B0T0F4_9ZZZZ